MGSTPCRATRRTVLKSLAAGAAVLAAGPDSAASPPAPLPRARPEDLGIDPAGIRAFVEQVNHKVGGLHSFMLLRRGQVAAEAWWAPCTPQAPHMLFSLSKSFASTAVGLAVAEGRLSLDATVASFFPDDLPREVSPNLAAMRLRHLLTMATGHDKDATGPTVAAPDGNWVRAFLSLPVEHAPGSKFVYNSAATYMCSAIVQKVTGQTLLRWLTPRVFRPLGIQRPAWDSCPRGINVGGWGLSVKTEDIARFGQLYLQKGQWNGRRILPEEWVAQATAKQISNGDSGSSDWSHGYGYQFWRCRHGAYRGDGAFGQFCIVMPDRDAVLAITSGVPDMQAVMNAAWECLLPAMTNQRPASAADSRALAGLLASLSVPGPAARPDPPLARRISGREIRFEPNGDGLESAVLEFQRGECRAALRDRQCQRILRCRPDSWTPCTLPREERPGLTMEAPAAVRAAWTADNTWTLRICFPETPFVETDEFRFEDGRVTVARRLNVSFGSPERAPLRGRLA